MDNTQNNQPNTETKENKDKQLSPLGEIELEACRFKFEGFSYKESAERLKMRFGENAPSEQTLRIWFCRSGRVQPFYDAYAEAEAKIRRFEARDMFRAQLKEAVRTLVTLMSTSPMDTVRIAAAKEIINRELGEPLKLTGDIGKDPAQRILEVMGIIKKQDGGENIKDA
jgi:hypothetical protein